MRILVTNVVGTIKGKRGFNRTTFGAGNATSQEKYFEHESTSFQLQGWIRKWFASTSEIRKSNVTIRSDWDSRCLQAAHGELVPLSRSSSKTSDFAGGNLIYLDSPFFSHAASWCGRKLSNSSNG